MPIFGSRQAITPELDKTHFDIHLTQVFDIVRAIYVLENRLLGTNIGFGAAIAFGYLSIKAENADISGTNISHVVGFGDLYLVPVYWGWHGKTTHYNITGFVEVPIGACNPNRLASFSAHYWALDILFAFTYLGDSKTKISAAAKLLCVDWM